MENEIEAEINRLSVELILMKEYHLALWEAYGSELCAGDLIHKENKLESRIKILKQAL